MKDKIQKSAANQHINWHFSPGIMTKTGKQAIRAILGTAVINDEKLTTAFTGEEALINSRPLTYQTMDHFLHGEMGGQLAPELTDEKGFNIKKR